MARRSSNATACNVRVVNSTDPKTGKRRLDNPKDFVRVEIRGALTRDIPVVPVMLDGAEIPDETQLPDDIKGLLSRNAEFVEYRNFDADVQRLLKKLGVGVSAKTAAPAAIAGTRYQAIEPSTRSSAEDFETQGDHKAREKRTLGREWTKRWLNPMVGLAVLLAAAAVGALVYWSPGPMSGKKPDVADSVDRARQAAEVHAVDAEKARQAAEAQAAEAEKARQVAEKARQDAEAKAADAEKARQAASKTAEDAERARQAATAKAAEADKARQAAETKATEATDAAAKSAQARQAAEVHAAEADKARQAAEAKAAGQAAAPVPSPTTAGTVTSGLASPSGQFSRRSNMEAFGTADTPWSAAATSIVDCEQHCARSNTCKVFTYNKAGGCYLFSVGISLRPNIYYDSGIRD